MELSARQLEQFDRDGFLVVPDLFSRNRWRFCVAKWRG
jgi:ectoine hydroxylase